MRDILLQHSVSRAPFGDHIECSVYLGQPSRRDSYTTQERMVCNIV